MAKKSLYKYKAAVIGGGRIGLLAELDAKLPKPVTHAGAFLVNKRLNFVGVAEIDPKKRRLAEKILPKKFIFASAEKLLRATKPDIVSVATPDETHWPMVALAVKHGVRLIICEKPIAVDLSDAQKIIAACKKAEVILIVNHMRRFDPLLGKFQKMIRSGKLGAIHQIRCLYVNGLLNNGTHLVDLIRWYAGEVVAVQGFYNKQFSFTHSGDYNVDGFLELTSGARVALQSLEKNNYYLWEVEFYGEKGAVFVRDLGFRIQTTPVAPSGSAAGFKELAWDRAKNYGQPRSYFSSIADHAVACLDGRAKPADTGEDGLAALKILLALRQSADQNGKKINL